MAAWAGLGYYARARNLLACARAVAARGGPSPRPRRSCAPCPASAPTPRRPSPRSPSAARRPWWTAMSSGSWRASAPSRRRCPPPSRELAALAAELTPAERPGDHAQAMMDLGATICTPRSPACGICPWRAFCLARARGIAAELPRRQRKAAEAGPARHRLGRAARGRAVAPGTPPGRGLLGGMLGWPGTGWDAAPPRTTRRRPSTGAHRRGAPHLHPFPPAARGARRARCRSTPPPSRGRFRDLDPADLPTVMRKAHALAAPVLR